MVAQDFDVTLEFLSDWHIGTGQGRLGTIDAEVRRDPDGLPFVPAKTLVGVWRDACETVAATFERASTRPGAWQAWVTWLFGSQPNHTQDPTATAGLPPAPATLRLTPAHAPRWLREAVRGRPALAQATVVLRPGVAIDKDTGTAVDRKLRVEERAIRGLRLTARVTLAPDADGQVPETAELLLRAGARLVEALGGKRNRGSGRVAVLLPGTRLDTTGTHPVVTDARLCVLLAAALPDTPPPPPPLADAPQPHEYGRRYPDQRHTVRVVLRVDTPVVAAHDVLGNVITSRDAIPGTALLGTVLSRVEPLDPHHAPPAGVGLGDIAVGDAQPAVADPSAPGAVRPAYAAPMVWQRGGKGRGPDVRNTLTGAADRNARGKAMTGRIAATADGWRHVGPHLTVSAHGVIDDDARRPTNTGGGIFTHLGIAPGTLLCTDIALPAATRLRLSPGEHLRFGRSRKDDFGMVTVVAVESVATEAPATDTGSGPLRVWCVSDVLLRDERLAPDPSPEALARTLSRALAPASCAVIRVANPGAEKTPVATVGAATRRDGFTVAWGRPRPSQVALRAGSVISLEVTGELDPARLAALTRDGIGERTAEGYGRIRFNPPELAVDKPTVHFPDRHHHGDPPDTPPGTRDPDPGGGPGAQPHPIEVNAWRRAIRRASAALAPDDLIKGISGLARRRAQLGALRAQLEQLPQPGGPDLVRTWIEGTRAIRARREAWTDEILKDLEAVLITKPDRIWERLRLAGEHRDLVLGPGREDLLRSHLHTEAVVTAVTDMLRRLARDQPQPTSADGVHAATATETRS